MAFELLPALVSGFNEDSGPTEVAKLLDTDSRPVVHGDMLAASPVAVTVTYAE